jgi:electron transport complex protein RnfG
MKPIIKLASVLFIVTAVSALLLGLANMATKDIISANDEKLRQEAMKTVLPGADMFGDDVYIDGGAVIAYTEGYIGEMTEGYVFMVETTGYAGRFNVFVGICVDGKTVGVAMGPHKETPGLGKKAEKPKFTDQYIGSVGPYTVTKKGRISDTEIDAIAASTITSQAMTNAVNAAHEYFEEYLQRGGAR